VPRIKELYLYSIYFETNLYIFKISPFYFISLIAASSSYLYPTMQATYIYIHGFNSDGNGWKARALEQHFPKARIIAPDFPANPVEVMKQLDEILETLIPTNTFLLGTSLGGFYAYICSAKYNMKAYLFNPSLEPYHTLNDRGIGHFSTWTKQRSYIFLADYLLLLKQMKQRADHTVNIKNISFFLATDDDVLDHSKINEQFPKANIEWFDKAGHSFSKFEKVLKIIKKSTEK